MITQSLTWSLELGSGSYSAVGSTEVEMEDVLLGEEIEDTQERWKTRESDRERGQ